MGTVASIGVTNDVLNRKRWKPAGLHLPFEHVKPGGRRFGGRERADRPRWSLPRPAGTPESLAGRQSLRKKIQKRQSNIQVADTLIIRGTHSGSGYKRASAAERPGERERERDGEKLLFGDQLYPIWWMSFERDFKTHQSPSWRVCVWTHTVSTACSNWL